MREPVLKDHERSGRMESRRTCESVDQIRQLLKSETLRKVWTLHHNSIPVHDAVRHF